MDNIFQNEIKSHAAETQKQIELKKNQLSWRKQRENKLAQSSRNLLYGDFINNNSSKNDLKKSLIQGTIPLINPDFHCFRDRNKEQELDQSGGIRVKNFMLAKDRAQLQQTIFQENYLQIDMFNPNLPHKNHSYWLRQREIGREQQEMRYGTNDRTENQNLTEQFKKNTLDLSSVDTKMIYAPDWKQNNKEKWVAGQFYSQNCTYRGKRQQNDSWQQMPFNSSQPDKYIQGFEILGDLQTVRQRNKQLEFNKPEFISIVKKDVWQDSLLTSKSIRTHKQDTNLNSIETIDVFSKGNSLKNYKSTLVSTKSVDHFVPYKHSNNQRGNEMNNLRPVFDKIYKNSVINMLNLSSIKQTNSLQSQQLFHSNNSSILPIIQQDENKSQYIKIDKQQNILQSFNSIKNDVDSDISSITEKVAPRIRVVPQKDYLPWEQPPQSEVSMVVSKYFSSKPKSIVLARNNSKYQIK